MAIVGVAKFLECEKTLVKNPSEAVGPYKTTDGDNIDVFVCLKQLFILDFKFLNKL